MYFINKLYAAVIITGMMGFGSSANALTYQCTVSKVSPHSNWIAPKITFRFDGKGGVTIMDSKVQDFGGGVPLVAKARKRPNGKIVITWRMSTIRTNINTRQPLRLYTAEITPDAHGLLVYAKQAGHSHKVRGRGQCRLRK